VGRHSKPSRIRFPQAMPAPTAAATAAVPTLAGVVAAFVLTQQAPSAVAEADAHAGRAPHQAWLDTTLQPVVSAARLLSAARQAAAQRSSATAGPVSYTVQAGDTLSSIAARVYHNANAWPVLYWANHGTGKDQIQWANDIGVGQVLRVPARPATIPSPPGQLTAAPTYVPKHASSAPVVAQSSAQSAPPAGSASSWSGPWPGGAFGQCVVSRESGGQAQIMNSSGHYGLYQFSASTWAAYGGNPADFGHASVAEQNQVFANALAAGGQDNWAPYDGC
jgi:LysM repeat protein